MIVPAARAPHATLSRPTLFFRRPDLPFFFAAAATAQVRRVFPGERVLGPQLHPDGANGDVRPGP